MNATSVFIVTPAINGIIGIIYSTPFGFAAYIAAEDGSVEPAPITISIRTVRWAYEAVVRAQRAAARGFGKNGARFMALVANPGKAAYMSHWRMNMNHTPNYWTIGGLRPFFPYNDFIDTFPLEGEPDDNRFNPF